MPLATSDVETVINFLRDKIEADDLPQIEEILARNTTVETGAHDDDFTTAHVPGRPPPASMNYQGSMDSRGRRDFERQNGLSSRRIRSARQARPIARCLRPASACRRGASAISATEARQ